MINMARPKKVEKKEEEVKVKQIKAEEPDEKDELLVRLLKVFGLFIHVVGIYIYVIVLTTVALSSVGTLVSTGTELSHALSQMSMLMFKQVTIFMGITLIYEVINYVLYLYEADRILLMATIVEAATFAFIGILYGFSLISMYIMIVPIFTGIINYSILLLKKLDEEE